ncbi:hypothetical protein GCM10010308_75930 [Streptomyces vinaceusdrappus]|nr:hypothetical protein [Streptomyces sp. Osf17]MBU8547450.1 hypothetical protein [Streptomyces sp. Osf17]GHC45633.1 hypothetical protein GCM10010308_75930 [Streptomyces vinaceusdrappus]
MPSHKTAAGIGVVAATLALTGCGNDLFSNMNGTRKANSAPPSATDPHSPPADSPPNYGDNTAARRPEAMAREDQQAATARTQEVKAALRTQQQRGRISPELLLPVLEDIALPWRVEVSNRTTGTAATTPTDGSVFGIYVGETACISGAVSSSRIWVNVNGHFPETGCIEPPPAH